MRWFEVAYVKISLKISVPDVVMEAWWCWWCWWWVHFSSQVKTYICISRTKDVVKLILNVWACKSPWQPSVYMMMPHHGTVCFLFQWPQMCGGRVEQLLPPSSLNFCVIHTHTHLETGGRMSAGISWFHQGGSASQGSAANWRWEPSSCSRKCVCFPYVAISSWFRSFWCRIRSQHQAEQRAEGAKRISKLPWLRQGIVSS